MKILRYIAIILDFFFPPTKEQIEKWDLDEID